MTIYADQLNEFSSDKIIIVRIQDILKLDVCTCIPLTFEIHINQLMFRVGDCAEIVIGGNEQVLHISAQEIFIRNLFCNKLTIENGTATFVQSSVIDHLINKGTVVVEPKVRLSVLICDDQGYVDRVQEST
ncbi:Hypothetical_protein [Hexamita inflata]|uniref:Hypothetical_protein n=1 Tax=Hexamita inflata TaxID=28002 RepID=A0AA86P706_9EUKA|nr:Hypothetical protein HINF_LOCUS19299 [Hexamita inflata]